MFANTFVRGVTVFFADDSDLKRIIANRGRSVNELRTIHMKKHPRIFGGAGQAEKMVSSTICRKLWMASRSVE